MKAQIICTLLFQFHKGTIRTVNVADSDAQNLNFNSIKVRLEHDDKAASKLLASLFQFHKGTIRTTTRALTPSLPTSFQFHKGTIRTRYAALGTFMLQQFQFHKGTIRTSLNC